MTLLYPLAMYLPCLAPADAHAAACVSYTDVAVTLSATASVLAAVQPQKETFSGRLGTRAMALLEKRPARGVSSATQAAGLAASTTKHVQLPQEAKLCMEIFGSSSVALT